MSYPVNAVKPIRSQLDRIITEADGSVWLLSGCVDEDLVTYPDALVRTQFHPPYDTKNTPTTNPEGMSWDGTYLWVMHSSGDRVQRLDEFGEETGLTFVTAEATSPTGICATSTHLWVANDNGNLYKYDKAGVYTGTTVNITSNDPEAIAYDGGQNFYVLDDSGNLYEHDKDTGVETGNSWSLSAITGYTSLYYGAEFKDANTLFVLGTNEVVFEIDWVTKTSRGMTYRYNDIQTKTDLAFLPNDRVVLSDSGEERLYFAKHFLGVGMGTHQTKYGVPMYIRIK